jgi:4,5-DOPA dioxygenase extradiol
MDTQNPTPSTPMPALFIGHGSPMNAIEDNPFSRSLKRMAGELPRPRAILVVSAHWVTEGTRVTSQPRPNTIHDFGGFPRELYEVVYPAPGDPALAGEIAELADGSEDGSWGFDHASWAVVRHMYPDADVPMLELSLDAYASPQAHFETGRRLAPLRDRGVLVIGSGNVVHNLAAVRWQDGAEPYPWAVEFDGWVRDRLVAGDDAALVGYESLGRTAALAHPTSEHYLPLLYAAALRRTGEPVSFFHEGIDMGSVSMRGVRFG